MNLINFLLILHFILSALVGLFAKKVMDRDFLSWFVISLVVPVIGAIALLIIGYDGVECPNCHHKVRKSAEICPHCGFNLKEFTRKHDDFVHFAHDLYEEKRLAEERATKDRVLKGILKSKEVIKKNSKK